MSTDPRFDGPGPDEVWKTALSEGRFQVQHCRRCLAYRFPPALVCAACGSPNLEWKPASGRGAVYSTTTVRDRAGDYNVSLIALDEGPRMMSRVEGIAPEEVRIGLRVVARIVPEEDPFVVFDPAGDAS